MVVFGDITQVSPGNTYDWVVLAFYSQQHVWFVFKYNFQWNTRESKSDVFWLEWKLRLDGPHEISLVFKSAAALLTLGWRIFSL